MKSLTIFALAFLLLLGLLYSCSRTTSQTPVTESPSAEKTAQPVSKADWQKKWDNVVAEAKKEGVISLYALWRPETRTVLTKAFGDKYGIRLEYTPFGRGAELFAKVEAEKRAGLQVVDVIGAGGGTLVATMKPAGVLGQIEPLLILPEVIDSKNWNGDKFPFIDKDKQAIAMIAAVDRDVIFNTGLIKQGEITSIKDVLKPQYEGKITMNDPSVTGPGNAFMTLLAVYIWNVDEAKDFLRQLLVQQKAVVVRDNRIHIEEVARGKYAIGIAPLPDSVTEFLRISAPIDAAIVKEGVYVTPAAGAIAIPTKPAHPNATALFVNWLLSKEGQDVFSQSFGNPSLRKDVSAEGVPPVMLPHPGEKLHLQSEDFINFQGKMLTITKEIIDEAQRK